MGGDQSCYFPVIDICYEDMDANCCGYQDVFGASNYVDGSYKEESCKNRKYTRKLSGKMYRENVKAGIGESECGSYVVYKKSVTADEVAIAHGGECHDHDELVERVTKGKVASCQDALGSAHHEHLSCDDLSNEKLHKAGEAGLIDLSELGEKSFSDICCESCHGVEELGMLNAQTGFSSLNIQSRTFEADQIAVMALALVGVFTIVKKLYSVCKGSKETYQTVSETQEEI